MKRGLDEVFDWQVFFPGFDPASPVPQVPWCARLRAARVMVHAVHSLKRYGWIAASRFISQIERVEGCPQDWSSINGVGLARRELTLARVLHRFVDPSGACLSRATALAAFARALGLPAQVVTGRARAMVNPTFRFHAWVELHGVVLFEAESVQQVYSVIQRAPDGEASLTAP